MTWRLTRSTAFAEIEDLLSGLKQRLEQANVQLMHVYVDDCCRVHDKYKSVFGNVEVLLGLFHACWCITSTTNKSSVLSLQFGKEFGLIFRQDEDQGNIRLKHTPDRVKIEENLNALIDLDEDFQLMFCKTSNVLKHCVIRTLATSSCNISSTLSQTKRSLPSLWGTTLLPLFSREVLF